MFIIIVDAKTLSCVTFEMLMCGDAWRAGVKGLVKSKSMVEWNAVETRRSSRNFSVPRRAWHHLLRANPDEHDPMSSQHQTSAVPSGKKQQSKSTSLKYSSHLLKSVVPNTLSKMSLSQRKKVSQKGLVSDHKRSHRKLAADLDQTSKKPHDVSVPFPMTASVPAAHEAVLSQSFRFTENGLVHSEQEQPPDMSFLSYR